MVSLPLGKWTKHLWSGLWPLCGASALVVERSPAGFGVRRLSGWFWGLEMLPTEDPHRSGSRVTASAPRSSIIGSILGSIYWYNHPDKRRQWRVDIVGICLDRYMKPTRSRRGTQQQQDTHPYLIDLHPDLEDLLDKNPDLHRP